MFGATGCAGFRREPKSAVTVALPAAVAWGRAAAIAVLPLEYAGVTGAIPCMGGVRVPGSNAGSPICCAAAPSGEIASIPSHARNVHAGNLHAGNLGAGNLGEGNLGDRGPDLETMNEITPDLSFFKRHSRPLARASPRYGSREACRSGQERRAQPGVCRSRAALIAAPQSTQAAVGKRCPCGKALRPRRTPGIGVVPLKRRSAECRSLPADCIYDASRRPAACRFQASCEGAGALPPGAPVWSRERGSIGH
jgi:hypothetical protein